MSSSKIRLFMNHKSGVTFIDYNILNQPPKCVSWGLLSSWSVGSNTCKLYPRCRPSRGHQPVSRQYRWKKCTSIIVQVLENELFLYFSNGNSGNIENWIRVRAGLDVQRRVSVGEPSPRGRLQTDPGSRDWSNDYAEINNVCNNL